MESLSTNKLDSYLSKMKSENEKWGMINGPYTFQDKIIQHEECKIKNYEFYKDKQKQTMYVCILCRAYF